MGTAASDVDNAVRAIQSAGSRAILVVARASSWTEEVDPVEAAALGTMGSGRAGLHVISRGEDLSECLG
jgi:hypothetical protein